MNKENETLGDVLKEYKKNGKEYIYIGDLCFEIDKCFNVEEENDVTKREEMARS